MKTEKFNFLVVTIGVIIGLGIVHILTSIADIIHYRNKINYNWFHIVWAGVVFLQLVLYWYVLFTWEDIGKNFTRYFFEILFPVFSYLSAATLLPNLKDINFDMKTYYMSNHWVIFSFFFLSMLMLLLHELLLEKNKDSWKRNLSRTAGLLIIASLVISNNTTLHATLAVVSFVFMSTYIILWRYEHEECKDRTLIRPPAVKGKKVPDTQK